MCGISYVASGDSIVGGNCQKWRTYNMKKRSPLEEHVTNFKDYNKIGMQKKKKKTQGKRCVSVELAK
jgi:hypothetical protein